MLTLTELQKRILANLEEAGEDDVSALTNTLINRQGSPDEIDEMEEALLSLLSCNLVQLARDRDLISKRWSPLPYEEAIETTANIKSCFSWSEVEQIWKWGKELPRLQVLLTNIGLTKARKILSEGDW